jgi:hypothetical protein
MAVEFSRKISHLTKKLRPGTLFISNGNKDVVPNQSNNLITSIIRFAKYKGMDFIPASTVDRLNNDRYFKYVFAELISDHHQIYHMPHAHQPYVPFLRSLNQGNNNLEKQKRLLELLKRPDLATDKDLCAGLVSYMKDFLKSMPHGCNERWSYNKIRINDPIKFGKLHKSEQEIGMIVGSINMILDWEGYLRQGRALAIGLNNPNVTEAEIFEYQKPHIMDKVMDLRAGLNNGNITETEKTEYLILCLDVFNTLMEKYGFSYRQLIQ